MHSFDSGVNDGGVPEKFAMLGLTFDDVLLLPAASDVVPSQVDTTSRLSRNITVRIPLLSSAMDTLAEADALCARYRISGVPVTDADSKLLGIITNRDLRFEADHSRPVREVMTPMPLVTGPVGISGPDAIGLLRTHKVEKLPLVDDAGRLCGLITVKDFVKSEKYPNATKDSDGRLVVGAAVGVGDDAYKRAQALIAAGVDFVVVDTAHGHSRGVLEMVAKLKANSGVDVIGG